MLKFEDMHTRMQRGWSSGKSDGTPCGRGSMLSQTEAIRAWLPELVKHYGIRSVADAGAGDLHWIKHVTWPEGVEYRPYDLIVRHPSVTEIDICQTALPACDLILCRAVLNHLWPGQVSAALRLFCQSSRYLLASQFDEGETGMRDFNRYDLRTFGLNEPIERIKDSDWELALWKL